VLQQNKELLIKGAKDLGIILNQKQISDIELFEQGLLLWNEVMNLTSIKDPQEIIIKHFIDSLSILKYVDIPLNSRFIDVGTGAGFPGAPIKIVRNDIDMTFLDSTKKKLNFIDNVINKLKYSNWEIVHSRAEDAGNNAALREQYDFASARAVAGLRILAEYCLPLVKIGGVFIAMKGADNSTEILDAKEAIALFGGVIENIYNFTLPYTELSRSIIVIRKQMHTPSKYPRHSNKLNKVPI
jgi:16S rRNA (guanine527-N7)-methyltransferase